MKNNQKIVCTTVFILGCIFIATTAYPNGASDPVSTAISSAYPAAHNSGTLADFPKLHPLVVHIPIMLIILAFFSQLASFFVFKRELSWVTMVLITGGFIGAVLATGIFHGGDLNLSQAGPVTRATFEKHDQYATYTVWLSGIAAASKIISHFFLKRKTVGEVVTTMLLAAAVYAVVITGDMGARLVHIDGVGVQGNELPAHDNR